MATGRRKARKRREKKRTARYTKPKQDAWGAKKKNNDRKPS